MINFERIHTKSCSLGATTED